MDIAKNILVAHDFSELGRGAMTQAIALAESLDAKLNVVTVYQGVDRGPSAESQAPELRELRQDLAELEATLKPSGRLAHAAIHYGQPAETILRSAQELHADLIVMGTHGRRGLNRMAMGSVAEAVLREARVPVLICKRTRA